MNTDSTQNPHIENTVKQWVSTIVIDLNLCPFAKREMVKDRIRYAITHENTWLQLEQCIADELDLLITNDEIETTLLIHPNALTDFVEYNQFLDSANDIVTRKNLEGIIQIASFHPDYQFANTQPEDAENYTNKSPYPMLHLIREASLETAIANYPDSDLIPDVNIEKVESLGAEKMAQLLRQCFVSR